MADEFDDDKIRNQAKETAEIVQDAFRSIASSISDMFTDAINDAEDSVATFAKTAQKDITKAVNQMAKYSDLLIKNEVKLSQGQLKSKDVRKQILELKAKEVGTIKALNVAARQGFITEEKKKKKVAEVLSITKEITKELEEQEKLANKMENKSKFFESMAKTIGSVPVLGKMLEGPFQKGAEAAKEAAGNGANFFQAQAAGAGAVVGEMFSISKIISLMVAGLFEVDTNVTALSKSMNISRESADNMEKSMRAFANASGESAITAESMMKSQAALETSSGIHMKRTNETLGTMSKLTENYGVSADQAARLEKLSKVTGKNFDAQVKATTLAGVRLAHNNGLNISQKKILEDVTKVTGALAAQLGNNPERIAKAVVQAKLLGTTLQGVANISKSLVNFETSISKELEAELLIGRDLNLERARALSLAGDQEGLAAELVDQVGTLAEFQDMNVIQQQMLAEAFGMSSDQMADMLEQQEYQNQMKEEQLTPEQESLEKIGQQVTLMKELMRMVVKLKDAFMTLYRGPLGKIAKLIKDIVSDGTTIKVIFGAIAGIIAGRMVMALGQAIAKGVILLGLSQGKAIAEITAASAITLGAGILAIVAAIGVGAAAMYSFGDDIMSPGAGMGGYGTRTLFGPEGAIALNNKDTVIAGTDLFQKGDDIVSAGEGEIQIPTPQLTREDLENALTVSLSVEGRDLGELSGQTAALYSPTPLTIA